ncbi:MAG: ATP-grasp domain-containing protein [Acidobacteria bacterium]|nr:ATP-grasp domain-containing protein [Acidobacteriota bacterium]
MKLHFLIVRRVPPVPSPVLLEAYEILRGRGYAVTEEIAEEVIQRPDQLSIEHDLYLLKSHTELSLALAGILYTEGANILNPYQSCSLIQSKIITSRLLRKAGVPAPDSWVTGDFELAHSLLERHPLIVKPHMGHRGAGIHLCKTAEDLNKIPPPHTPMIIQEAINGPGEDLKIYVIGDQVFGVQKPFSETSFSVPGRPVPITNEVIQLSQKVGQVCGLGLYGLDIIESDRGPYVVDVNYFPGYKGVPNAGPMIADYIDEYARGRVALVPPVLPVLFDAI